MVLETIIDTFSPESEVELDERLVLRTPEPMIIILVIYLLTVLKIAPSLMKSRPAYQLKTYIILYNVFQIFICCYLVYKIWAIDLPTFQFWKCVQCEPGSIVARDFNHICILTFWLKTIELSETVVFVLRKKQRQVSFLHVFHHCATLFLAYKFTSFYRSSSTFFPVLLNCTVHIWMYSYYLMAAVLPAGVVAKLTPFKKAITTTQMIQFVLFFTQIIVAYSLGCRIPYSVLAVYSGVIFAFLYMFYDFYKKNYSANRQAQKQAKS